MVNILKACYWKIVNSERNICETLQGRELISSSRYTVHHEPSCLVACPIGEGCNLVVNNGNIHSQRDYHNKFLGKGV